MTTRPADHIESVDAYMRPIDPMRPDAETEAARMKRIRRVLMRRGALSALAAVIGLEVSDHYGGLLGSARHHAVDLALAVSGAVVFLIFAITAVRATTDDVVARVPRRLGDARATSLRLICLLVGYVLIILGALSLLQVPATHLLLGGALTGVILGIAAQQVLANTFAGLMLLFARPFSVGDQVSIRSGALGGLLTGRVSGMSLTYVNLDTATGVVLLPNSAVLAATVGPPQWRG